jgi:tetratricopeptide (TPR) repeat protein
MKPGSIFTITVILVLCFYGIAAADDCGCGFGVDDPGPGDGLDTHDGDNSAHSGNDAADTSTDSRDSSSGTDYWSGDDDGSSSSSAGSDSTSSSGGGLVEDAIVWRMKGDDLYQKGLYNESLEAYEKAISYDPYTLKSWTGKGRVLLALGLPAGSADAFERAIRLDPGNAATYVQLGDALAEAGQYEQAVENYLKALAMNPNLAGVKEKISGAQEAPVVAMQTAEVTPEITIPPVIEETATGTVTLPGDTGTETMAVPGTPKAGVSGFPAILSLICLVFPAFRKK